MMLFGISRTAFNGASMSSSVAVMSISLLCGCSGNPGDKPVARTTGTVSYDGKPVDGGTLVFAPIADGKTTEAGKSGTATIKSDGTFSVSTHGDGDGAVIGQHRVLFSPAAVAPAPSGAHGEAPVSPYANLVPKKGEIDIFKGDNKVAIELVKPEAEQKPQ